MRERDRERDTTVAVGVSLWRGGALPITFPFRMRSARPRFFLVSRCRSRALVSAPSALPPPPPKMPLDDGRNVRVIKLLFGFDRAKKIKNLVERWNFKIFPRIHSSPFGGSATRDRSDSSAVGRVRNRPAFWGARDGGRYQRRDPDDRTTTRRVVPDNAFFARQTSRWGGGE